VVNINSVLDYNTRRPLKLDLALTQLFNHNTEVMRAK